MYSPKKLALKLGTDGPHKVLPTPRKIQVLFNGAYIIKTTKASFVWEHPYYPQLYFPRTELEREEAACEGELAKIGGNWSWGFGADEGV